MESITRDKSGDYQSGRFSIALGLMNPQEPERRDLETALAGALRQLGHLALDGGLLAQVSHSNNAERIASLRTTFADVSAPIRRFGCPERTTERLKSSQASRCKPR